MGSLYLMQACICLLKLSVKTISQVNLRYICISGALSLNIYMNIYLVKSAKVECFRYLKTKAYQKLKA